MDNNIRKYIDIVMESSAANISKIARHCRKRGEGYSLYKDINVSIPVQIQSKDFSAIITYIGIVPDKLFDEQRIIVNVFYDNKEFVKGQPISDLKVFEKTLANNLKYKALNTILLDIGFSESSSNIFRINSTVADVVSKGYDIIQFICINTSRTEPFFDEFYRAIRYKQAMDEMS